MLTEVNTAQAIKKAQQDVLDAQQIAAEKATENKHLKKERQRAKRMTNRNGGPLMHHRIPKKRTPMHKKDDQGTLDQLVYDSDDSHSEMSSDKYSTFTKAHTNNELEFGEIIFVCMKNKNGQMKTECHTSTNPVWNIHGLCYLAVIKI